ncbi:hypothetical protein MKW98_012105 [Papaver atlanticum]|uniref:Uncharacterized protein n=1 Tax=Papaver atlanticum TaxID=357466 RepID=A0AAD4THT8_9MAGN|nr:hypothetical protein MKW98_012105 [Papaver atlanticum]
MKPIPSSLETKGTTVSWDFSFFFFFFLCLDSSLLRSFLCKISTTTFPLSHLCPVRSRRWCSEDRDLNETNKESRNSIRRYGIMLRLQSNVSTNRRGSIAAANVVVAAEIRGSSRWHEADDYIMKLARHVKLSDHLMIMKFNQMHMPDAYMWVCLNLVSRSCSRPTT